MNRLLEVQKKLSELDAARAALKAEEDACLACTEVTCTSSSEGRGCGVKTEIKKLTYIQTHWYVEPYGCTGGGFWREGEGRFKCPHCGTVNRLYDRPEVQNLKRHFAGVEDAYD